MNAPIAKLATLIGIAMSVSLHKRPLSTLHFRVINEDDLCPWLKAGMQGANELNPPLNRHVRKPQSCKGGVELAEIGWKLVCVFQAKGYALRVWPELGESERLWPRVNGDEASGRSSNVLCPIPRATRNFQDRAAGERSGQVLG